MKKVKNERYDIKRCICGSSDIYSIEYKCTHKEIVVTTNNIVTVKESNKKPQLKNIISESNQGQSSINVVFPSIATSLKAFKDKMNAIKIQYIANFFIWVPTKKPIIQVTKAPNNGNNIINKYIFLFLMAKSLFF